MPDADAGGARLDGRYFLFPTMSASVKGAMTIVPFPTSLEECHEMIRRLREENTHLREAASTFGQLAERLNHELQVERSLYSDATALERTRTSRSPSLIIR
jgi:hypothetical protein